LKRSPEGAPTFTMRPIRLLVSLCFCILTITILLFLIPGQEDRLHPSTSKTKKKSYLNAFFSFHTPLFPPSAIISLTDDNSTFFLARPAAFGPLLPSSGLSGQIWIGSGFGDDNLGRGGRAEGELGCSDVPGWDENLGKLGHITSGRPKSKFAVPESKSSPDKDKDKTKRSEDEPEADTASQSDSERKKTQASDGTDDHLHHPLPDSDAPKPSVSKSGSKHADIQSLQESAEITGKIVLLSRGGCGFLEKVKWVQRRGGVALIVGDDVRGGPLVTMYASGDTSNITVQALFTSYTTAHLLSSLIPSGSSFGKFPGKAGKLGKTVNGKGTKTDTDNKPNFTPIPQAAKPTSVPKSSEETVAEDGSTPPRSHRSWLRSILYWIGFGSSGDPSGVSRRPPSSGRLDWVMVEDWEDAEPSKSTSKSGKQPKNGETILPNPATDDFVIGVHDWRDKDLLHNKQNQDGANMKPRKAQETKSKAKTQLSKEIKLKGGSITPGSGEYEKPASSQGETAGDRKTMHSASGKGEPDSQNSEEGWLGHLHWGHGKDDVEESHDSHQCAGNKCTASSKTSHGMADHGAKGQDEKGGPQREGLWVTLTPTNMSSSPFFDTLLVLVVSPLVTLTVVYALLLLRSRIRRRRWRAPKSVVERLPVRTYHTISSEASTTSIATPASSSPTTPLLQPSSTRRAISRSHSRSRPRSRTTSEVPEGATSSSPFNEHNEALSAAEKREAGLAEWRRRYGGRQKECVVCLEEYIDGVSRVMSLPCGHEFHVECMYVDSFHLTYYKILMIHSTPWLTTRRRTCPICKGDVVRSMQRGSLSRQNSYDRRHHDSSSDDDEEDIQAQAAQTRNDSPTAALPITPTTEDTDLERGLEPSRSRSPNRESWRSWAASLFSGFGTNGNGSSGRRHEVDRDR
jgi:hypothetical protein